MNHENAHITPEEARRRLHRQYLLPSVVLGLAAFLIVVSVFFPYWTMTLEAPQYPKGLEIQLYVNHMTGDVAEIDGLNHYIGMRPLGEAASLERATSLFAIVALSLVSLSVIFVHNKWAALIAFPALVYPAVFLGDLFFWLMLFGQNLDPTAALSSSVDPFTPPLIGSKQIANFVVITRVQIGFWITIAADVLLIVGLYLHRKTYKPLIEAAHAVES